MVEHLEQGWNFGFNDLQIKEENTKNSHGNKKDSQTQFWEWKRKLNDLPSLISSLEKNQKQKLKSLNSLSNYRVGLEGKATILVGKDAQKSLQINSLLSTKAPS